MLGRIYTVSPVLRPLITSTLDKSDSPGESDLSNVEVINGLNTGDTVYILPSKSLFDYQQRFRERVNASFSFG